MEALNLRSELALAALSTELLAKQFSIVCQSIHFPESSTSSGELNEELLETSYNELEIYQD